MWFIPRRSLWYSVALTMPWPANLRRGAGRINVSEAFFSEDFPSDFEAMMPVLGRAVEALRGRGCLEGGAEPRVRLCLEEALVNAIRHGNCCDPGRRVHVSAAEENGHLAIRVCDEGRGFAPKEIRVPEPDRMGGRGLYLIQHYMDSVEFIPSRGCLVMKFRPGTMQEGE